MSLAIEIKSVDDYVPYFHTRNYLLKKRNESGLSPHELMEQLGYRDLDKFYNQLHRWHECRGRIPHNYLETLGVDFRTLEFTIELDQELYDVAASLPVSVNGYIKGKMPGFYRHYDFPEPMDYRSVLEFLLDKSMEEPAHYFIRIPGIKLVDVSHGEVVHETHYRPGMWSSRNWVVFKDQGRHLAAEPVV